MKRNKEEKKEDSRNWEIKRKGKQGDIREWKRAGNEKRRKKKVGKEKTKNRRRKWKKRE